MRKLEAELADARGLIEMAEAENDAAMVTDAENSLLGLNKRAEQMRLESMLSGEADGNDSYIEIHAGAGGTESQDWASMLLRMYTRWAERHDYKLQLIEESEGEGCGNQVHHPAGQGRERLWLAEDRGGGAPAGADFALLTPMPGGTPHSRRSPSIR